MLFQIYFNSTHNHTEGGRDVNDDEDDVAICGGNLGLWVLSCCW